MKKRIIAMLCLVSVLFLVACQKTVKAEELSKNYVAENVEVLAADDAFSTAYNDISANLLKTAYSSDNTLISPLSVELAFSMLTNGAVGKTKQELESFLSGLDIETLNKYNKAYVEGIKESDKLSFNVANSIWIKKDPNLSVKDKFLQTNANYYGAQVYSSQFDGATLKDINNWVSIHTDGMIKKILDDIDADTVMYLINAICLEAKWQDEFEKENVVKWDFNNLNGSKTKVDMMCSTEYNYVSGDKATGFMKKYVGGRYAFCALLPDENVNINDFVLCLDSQTLKNYFTATQEKVIIKMPKMKVEYSLDLIEALQALGINDVFDGYKADLSDMAAYTNSNLFVNMAMHKTFMEVDTAGTKAGAATIIGIGKESAVAPDWNQPKYVTLDRPFVYAILDTQTKMPIFIGVQAHF